MYLFFNISRLNIQKYVDQKSYESKEDTVREGGG